jgi:uncharacterized membrane protein
MYQLTARAVPHTHLTLPTTPSRYTLFVAVSSTAGFRLHTSWLTTSALYVVLCWCMWDGTPYGI